MMTLAIHHIDRLHWLEREARTGDWPQKGIVPWTTPALVRARPISRRLVDCGLLRKVEVGDCHTEYLSVFRHRLRTEYRAVGLTVAEVKLLFLADHLGSVLLTGEPVVARMAREIGLRVCHAPDEPETFFAPGETSAPFGLKSGEEPQMIEPEHSGLYFSHQFPSRRRVPEEDESVPKPTVARSSGSNGVRSGQFPDATATKETKEENTHQPKS